MKKSPHPKSSAPIRARLPLTNCALRTYLREARRTPAYTARVIMSLPPTQRPHGIILGSPDLKAIEVF